VFETISVVILDPKGNGNSWFDWCN